MLRLKGVTRDLGLTYSSEERGVSILVLIAILLLFSLSLSLCLFSFQCDSCYSCCPGGDIMHHSVNESALHTSTKLHKAPTRWSEYSTNMPSVLNRATETADFPTCPPPYHYFPLPHPPPLQHSLSQHDHFVPGILHSKTVKKDLHSTTYSYLLNAPP